MIIGGWLSIFFIVLALLKIKKVVPQNYFLVSKRERAKHDIFILALTSPAWLLLMIDLYIARKDIPKVPALLPIFSGIIFCYFIYCFFVISSTPKQDGTI